MQQELFIKFAEFEEKCKEPERARAIYKYALDHIPKGQAQDVYKRFVAFEKQHGDREGIEVHGLYYRQQALQPASLCHSRLLYAAPNCMFRWMAPCLKDPGNAISFGDLCKMMFCEPLLTM